MCDISFSRYRGGIGTQLPSTSDDEPIGSVFPGFDALAEDAAALIVDLVEFRRRRGLSQTEVAERMGTSQSALARLESGRTDLRLSTVTRYADALGVDLAFAVRSRGGRNR